MAKIRKLSVFIWCTLLIVGFNTRSFAQDTYYVENPRTFNAGLVGGANFTQVDGDYYAGYHRVGINAGGIIYTRISNNLQLSLEILYSQKGSHSDRERYTLDKNYLISKYDINLHYAEVPLMLSVFDKHRSHFGAGLSFSRLITYNETATVISTSPTLPPYSVPDFYKEYPFKKYDVQFVVGGNLHLVGGFYLNARFQYSLMPVHTKLSPDFARANQYNNVWTIRVMYLF